MIYNKADESYKAFDPNYAETDVDIIEIKRETTFAWLITIPLKTKETADLWFPKKECKIRNGKLFAPKWMFNLKNKELRLKRASSKKR